MSNKTVEELLKLPIDYVSHIIDNMPAMDAIEYLFFLKLLSSVIIKTISEISNVSEKEILETLVASIEDDLKNKKEKIYV